MAQIHVERTIEAAPDRVFAWLVDDPSHLTAAGLMFRAGWIKGSTPGVGAVRQVIGAGVWLREEVTAYDAPNSYSYQIIRSFPPIEHQGGTLTCTPSGTGTRVDWSSAYTHPAHMGGRYLEALTSRAIDSGFNAVLTGCAKALER